MKQPKRIKSKTRHRAFLINLTVPKGVSIKEIKEYIQESVATYKGCLDPEYPIFDLDGDSVKVKQFTTKTKEWKKLNV